MLRNTLKRLVCENSWTNTIYQLSLLSRLEETKGWQKHFRLEDTLFFAHPGAENHDKNLYLVEFENPTNGFFALWVQTLYRILYAERFNLTPVIKWGKNTAYWEPSLAENSYENYFEPIVDISWESANRSANVVYCRGGVIDRITENIGTDYKSIQSNESIEIFARVQKKYITVKAEVMSAIQNEYAQLIEGRKTLAVHIRGVEWGNVKGHPIPLKLQDYMDCIDEAMEKHSFERIFLATDSDATVEQMQQRYGDCVVCFSDTVRTQVGSTILSIFDKNNQSEMKRFRMGYEVLRDMLALSWSDGLIAGYSNISLAARVWKKADCAEYCYLKLMEQQIQTKGLSSIQVFQLSRK